MSIMHIKFISFFAFIATTYSVPAPVVPKTTIYDEIVSVITGSCHLKPERFAPVKLAELCDTVLVNGSSSSHVVCNKAKEVITDGCKPENKDMLIKAVNATAGAPLDLSHNCKQNSSLNIFHEIIPELDSSLDCELICRELKKDTVYPVCPFIISYHQTKKDSNSNQSKVPVRAEAYVPETPDEPSGKDVPSQNSQSSIPSAPKTSNSLPIATNNSKTQNYQSPASQSIANSRTSAEMAKNSSNGTKATHQAPQPVLPVDKEPVEVKKPIDVGDEDDETNGNGVEVNEDENKGAINGDNVPAVSPNETELDNDNGDDNVDTKMELKPPMTEEISQNSNLVPEEFKPNMAVLKSEPFVESESSHFFGYFVFISAICIFFYVAMYNKKKILALMIEGRRSNVKRRPNSAAYSKLNCNLEEAMASGPSTSSSNTLLY